MIIYESSILPVVTDTRDDYHPVQVSHIYHNNICYGFDLDSNHHLIPGT